MICKDIRSEIIIKRIDKECLKEIQEKYVILQFELTGYQNDGYNVAVFEVLNKDILLKEDLEKEEDKELEKENAKLKKVINILRRCITGAYQLNYGNDKAFKITVVRDDLTVNKEEHDLISEVVKEMLKDA